MTTAQDSLEEIRLSLQALKLGQEQIKRDIEDQREKRDKDVFRLEERMSDLVTRAEFDPIKNMAYGAVGFILLAFLTGLAALVISVP